MKPLSYAARRCGSVPIAVLLASAGLAAGVAQAQTTSVNGRTTAPLTVPAGIYTGVISDPDGEPDTYTATVVITAKTLSPRHRAGTVSYSAATNDITFSPALSCHGTLSYLGRSSTTRFRFRESIAGGARAQCISGGTVTLTRVSGRVFAYRWTKRGFTDPAPTGRLTRTGSRA